MSFLQKIVEDSKKPKVSAIPFLQESLRGYKKPRSWETIHASDVAKQDYCPRAVILTERLGVARKDEFIGTALQATFDVGNSVAQLIAEKWLVKRAVGNWECQKCGVRRLFCKKPPQCPNHPGDYWRYEEYVFVDPVTKVSGSIDLLLEVGEPKLILYELKIMKAEDHEKLVAPLAEHRIRTSLYLGLVERSDDPNAAFVNTSFGGILYTSRGHGKMDKDFGEVLPFKEFFVKKDDESNSALLAKGGKVTSSRKDGSVPERICTSVLSPFAKNCPVSGECFKCE